MVKQIKEDVEIMGIKDDDDRVCFRKKINDIKTLVNRNRNGTNKENENKEKE